MSDTMIRNAGADLTVPTLLLLPEALARSRMCDAERAAGEHRLVRDLTAGRTWSRLARYAQRRAERARRR